MMKRLTALFSTLAMSLAASMAAAQETGAPDGLPGHYYLTGVMETGSELLIKPDGHFQWYLSVGALDLTAEGRWQSDGRTVTLTTDRPDPDGEIFRLGEQAPWEDHVSASLRHALERKAAAAQRERCPLNLNALDEAVTTSPPTLEGETGTAPPDRTAELRAQVEKVHAEAQQVLTRLGATPGWREDRALVGEANDALDRYYDAIWNARAAARDAAIEGFAFTLPAECRMDDWAGKAEAFQGVALYLFDPERHVRGNGVTVEAHYYQGPVARETVREGYAFFPVEEGRTITSLILRLPNSEKAATLPVRFSDPVVQAIHVDISSMIEPGFKELILQIAEDGSLRPEGELGGAYRKAQR